MMSGVNYIFSTPLGRRRTLYKQTNERTKESTLIQGTTDFERRSSNARARERGDGVIAGAGDLRL